MGLKDLFEGSHLLIIILVVVVLFGWKQLPDAARGLGRSMRILKSEVNDMHSESTATPSASSRDTFNGPNDQQRADPSTDPTA